MAKEKTPNNTPKPLLLGENTILVFLRQAQDMKEQTKTKEMGRIR